MWRDRAVEPLWPALGAAASMSFAVGWVRPVRLTLRPARWAAAGAIAGAVLALGVPTLAETWQEARPQSLEPFRLDLVAAYWFQPERTHAVVIDGNGSPGEVIEYQGTRFNIHHSDELTIDSSQVRRVRWLDLGAKGAWLTIRLDSQQAAALRRRTIHRLGWRDALFVNHQLVAVVTYSDVMVGRLLLHLPDRARLRLIYRTLVGHQP